MTLAANESLSGGFVRDLAGRLVTVASGGGSLTASEMMSGGFVRDQDGRLMTIASAGGPLTASEQLSGGFVRDPAGRLVISSGAAVGYSGGFQRDQAGRLVTSTSAGGALGAGEAFSGGFVRDVNGLLSLAAPPVLTVLGYNTMGTLFDSMGTGRMFVSKFTLAMAATLNELHGWFNDGGAAVSTIRLVIYKDVDSLNNPRPNATRVAYSNPILVTGGATVHLSQAGFSVALTAGDYWIGARSDVSGAFFRGDVLGLGALGIDGASDPPPNPFGIGTGTQSSTHQLSCWAVVAS